ncbi:stromal interaction molecule homolog isoform X3 [Homalodisca vitripennis]|uniref:stromal interaction molecule homolog isoform X3 n=1 Tax=Homalodisca vitripennis TaxID=197043 RepID=UPI001EEACA5C|nr:stromal interaction molecule homolog isoform X3 [Homalodisca vitripennis]
MLISRTAVFLVFIVINACGQQSDVKEPQSGDSSVKKEQPNLDKSSVKIGSSGFSEFKAYVLGSGESQCNDDLACLTMASMDRHGLEAIRSLHRQLDDDANGAVDLSESDEFLREELQYENGAEKRQRAFHRNDDMHISVKELWEAWVRSEVHNWTVEQTTEWLASSVELPQYVPIFIMHRVTGATLPRLAVSNMQYLSNVLGIKDPIHKQKIALKAMDVVLFGPPKDYTNYLKDLILVTLLLGALIGCWYAYRQNKNSRRHLRRMMKDMESLHKAELALENLQKELESAKQEKECATTEKQDLERRLQEQREDAGELRTSYSDLEVSQLKAEIEMLRNELQRAEGELKDCCWAPPPGLQQWLQLTHEIENKAYIKKKINAEKQLQQAREACEKLRKKRSSLIGAFASTHGKSIDDVDRSIVEARTSLNEVTQELAERCHRWKQIELLLGFNIINNSGLAVLESLLYRNQANGRGAGLRSRMSSSQDDLDDDTSSYSPTADRGGVESQGWKESESESEKQEDDEILTSRSAANVQFTIGSELEEVVPPKLPQYARSDSGRSSARIPRWQSQDIEPLGADREATTVGPKMSASETNLEAQAIAPPRMRRTARRMDRDPSVTQSIDDDPAYSTDSNSTAAEDSDKLKSKKHKISFPKFSRKSRQTPPPSLQPLPKTTYGCSNYLCQELLEM